MKIQVIISAGIAVLALAGAVLAAIRSRRQLSGCTRWKGVIESASDTDVPLYVSSESATSFSGLIKYVVRACGGEATVEITSRLSHKVGQAVEIATLDSGISRFEEEFREPVVWWVLAAVTSAIAAAVLALGPFG